MAKALGRPTSITETTVAKLVGALQRGLSVETACAYAQIDRATFYRHMKNNEDFCNTIKAARVFLELHASDITYDVLLDIQREREGHKRKYNKNFAARLAMWYLERKEPIAWSKLTCKNKCCTNNQVERL